MRLPRGSCLWAHYRYPFDFVRPADCDWLSIYLYLPARSTVSSSSVLWVWASSMGCVCWSMPDHRSRCCFIDPSFSFSAQLILNYAPKSGGVALNLDGSEIDLCSRRYLFANRQEIASLILSCVPKPLFEFPSPSPGCSQEEWSGR